MSFVGCRFVQRSGAPYNSPW